MGRLWFGLRPDRDPLPVLAQAHPTGCGFWRQVFNLTETIEVYEMIPGFFLAFLVTVVVSLSTYQKNDKIEQEFEEAANLAKLTTAGLPAKEEEQAAKA